jgi:tight adherence protein B
MKALLIFPAAAAAGVIAALIAAALLSRPVRSRNRKIPPASPPAAHRLRALARAFSEDPASPQGRRFVLLVTAAASALFLIATTNVIFTVICAAGTFFCLKFYAQHMADRRRTLFEDQLIEGLGIIRNSTAAGQSLMQALDTLAASTRPPLADAVAGVLRRTRLGMPLSESLDAFSREFESRDLRIAVLSLNLAKESGGNMGEILARLSATMRERKKIQGKIRSLTAQGKASGVVMSCVPLLLLVVLSFMQPDIMGLLFTTLAGNIMLAVVCIMIGTGAFVINRITRIDI